VPASQLKAPFAGRNPVPLYEAWQLPPNACDKATDGARYLEGQIAKLVAPLETLHRGDKLPDRLGPAIAKRGHKLLSQMDVDSARPPVACHPTLGAPFFRQPGPDDPKVQVPEFF